MPQSLECKEPSTISAKLGGLGGKNKDVENSEKEVFEENFGGVENRLLSSEDNESTDSARLNDKEEEPIVS